MRDYKSSIVYTCNNRIYRPGTIRDLAFAKSLIYLVKSICLNSELFNNNFFTVFLWRPLSCGGPWATAQFAFLKSGPDAKWLNDKAGR